MHAASAELAEVDAVAAVDAGEHGTGGEPCGGEGSASLLKALTP